MVSSIQTIRHEKLKVQRTDGYMPFHSSKKENLDGLLEVYVEDTLAIGFKTFEELTDMMSRRLESKPKECLLNLFADINRNSILDCFFLEQTNYCSQIDTLQKDTDFDTFRTTRHGLAWVS